MPNDFSFAPHENDPTDIAKNPIKHHTSAATSGAATGALAGVGAGAWLGSGGGFKRMRGAAGAGGLIGAGLGAGLGYHRSEKKQRTVEQMYGGGNNDPFALEKLSFDETYHAGRAFALQQLREKAAAGSVPQAFAQAGLPSQVADAFDYQSLKHGDDLWNNSYRTFHELAAQENLLVPKHVINEQISHILRARANGSAAEVAQDRLSRETLAHVHNRTVLAKQFGNHPLKEEITAEILQRHAGRAVPRAQPRPPSQTQARTSGTPATPQTPTLQQPRVTQSAAEADAAVPGPALRGPSSKPKTQASSPPRGSGSVDAPPTPPRQTLAEAAGDVWSNHKGKLGLGAAALGLSGLGYYAYMDNQRRQADAMFQPQIAE